MARHGVFAQRDLFTSAMPAKSLPPEVRQALLTLLETLLREVTATGTVVREGRSDEHDHA
jgi:hypothetical protein